MQFRKKYAETIAGQRWILKSQTLRSIKILFSEYFAMSRNDKKNLLCVHTSCLMKSTKLFYDPASITLIPPMTVANQTNTLRSSKVSQYLPSESSVSVLFVVMLFFEDSVASRIRLIRDNVSLNSVLFSFTSSITFHDA